MVSQRFIIVAGKGGVGRSTVSAAIALCYARKNYKTLLATSDLQEKQLSRIFGKKIGTKNTRLCDNLDAVLLEPMEAMSEYTLMVLKFRFLRNLLLGPKAMRNFISNVPGMAEWALIGKATYHLIEQEKGAYRYDKVVLDAPPTGHGLSLIKIPLYISRVLNSGPLRATALERLQLLTDPATTAIFIVSIPEEMAVSEALDLYENVTQEINIPVRGVLMNKTMPPLFSAADEENIRQLHEKTPHSKALQAALFRIQRTSMQQKQLKRMGGHLPVLELPEINKWRTSMDSIQVLSEILENYLFA